MTGRELAKLLMENPDAEVLVAGEGTFATLALEDYQVLPGAMDVLDVEMTSSVKGRLTRDIHEIVIVLSTWE